MSRKQSSELDELLDEILTDAYGEAVRQFAYGLCLTPSPTRRHCRHRFFSGASQPTCRRSTCATACTAAFLSAVVFLIGIVALGASINPVRPFPLSVLVEARRHEWSGFGPRVDCC